MGRDYIKLLSEVSTPNGVNLTKESKPSALISNLRINTLRGMSQKRSFSWCSNKLKSSHRIGPHNSDVVSVLIGSILGATHLEKRKNCIGTRIIFEQSNQNVEYLM
jgi:hypothetical protein